MAREGCRSEENFHVIGLWLSKEPPSRNVVRLVRSSRERLEDRGYALISRRREMVMVAMCTGFFHSANKVAERAVQLRPAFGQQPQQPRQILSLRSTAALSSSTCSRSRAFSDETSRAGGWRWPTGASPINRVSCVSDKVTPAVAG